VPCEPINKVNEGRPHIVDSIRNGEISFILNTPEGQQAIADSASIRKAALAHKVFCLTTLAAAEAVAQALALNDDEQTVRLLQAAIRFATPQQPIAAIRE